MNIEELTTAALALPEDERGFLAEKLLASLGPDLPDEDPEVFWREVMRRDEEMSSGKVQGIPHEEVMAAARRAIE